jgi:hypothetical protein
VVRHLKVSDEVYEQVLRVQGFLQARDGKRYTIDDVIRDLLTFATEAGYYSMMLVPEEEKKPDEKYGPFKIAVSRKLLEKEEGEEEGHSE